MKNILNKVLVSVLTIFILFSLFSITSFFGGIIFKADGLVINDSITENIDDELEFEFEYSVNSATYMYDIEKTVIIMQSVLEEDKGKLTEEKAEKISGTLNAVKDNLPVLINGIKNGMADGEIDYYEVVDVIENLVDVGISIAANFPPYGTIAAAAIDLVRTFVKLMNTGDEQSSELSRMEARLTEGLYEIRNQISSVEDQINSLSNQIANSTNQIINEVKHLLGVAEAKEKLNNFMISSGKYDFGYNNYRNYLFGEANGNNPQYNTAYYELFKRAQINNDVELSKYYCDKLYTSIMDNWDSLYSYVIENETGKSVVQCYYDVVKEYPNLIKNGLTPKASATLFAYDLYQTQLKTNIVLAECNFYQYTQMLLSEKNYYQYDKISDSRVYLSELNNLEKQRTSRIEFIKSQFAKDMAYIYECSDYYFVKESNNKFFEMYNNDSETFGNVIEGQTIYLTQIPLFVCDQFDFTHDDFTWKVAGNSVYEFTFKNLKTEAKLFYLTEEITSISFDNGKKPEVKFSGGSGSNADPYLIATPEQFLSIQNGLDKNYRLLCDIDFKDYNQEINPLGFKYNSNNAEVYDAFNGTLDGNGYTVKNLKITGGEYSGLFGKIGTTGVVKNINFYNVTVKSNIDKLNNTDSDNVFYAGLVAGQNFGVIKYCNINADNLNIENASIETTVLEYRLSTLVNLINDNGISIPFKIKETIDKLLSTVLMPTLDSVEDDDTREFLEKYLYLMKEDDTLMQNRKVSAYGVHVEVRNSEINNNITVYAGGIVGMNANTISCCEIINSSIIATTSHNFKGEDINTNKNNVYVGGIAAKNYLGKISYSFIDSAVYLKAYATSITNPTKKNSPIVTVNAGGIIAENYSNPLNGITNVESKINKHSIDCVSFINSKKKDYENAVEQKGAYISGYENNQVSTIIGNNIPEKIAKSKTKYTTEIIINNSEDLKYDAGTTLFNEENLILKVTTDDSEIKEFYSKKNPKEGREYFTISALYGFNTQNSSFTEIKTHNIVILFSVEIDGNTQYFMNELQIEVGKNFVKDKETKIIGLKEEYKNEFSSNDIIIYQYYAVGKPKSFYLNDLSIVKNWYLSETINGNYGKNIVDLTYVTNEGTFTVKDIEINIVCNHELGLINFIKNEELSTNATCSEFGKEVWECKNCEKQIILVFSKLQHNPDFNNIIGYKEPTCIQEGYSGEVHCKDCDTILQEGETLPIVSHEYICVNELEHKCKTCNHIEYHQYTVLESTKICHDDTGTHKVLVYTYTCSNTSCKYSHDVDDDNTIPTHDVPTLSVSNGYVLKGGDEVVVYVQITNLKANNLSFNGANFGIRYSDGLELVKVEDGNLVKGSLIKEDSNTNHGFNFACAKVDAVTTDGNLLKLTFKVDKNMKKEDIYQISVVYGTDYDDSGKQIQGGFVVDGENVKFATRSGNIKLVDRLPGDVNNDNSVDILDAITIAKYLVSPQGYGKDFALYANVNLGRQENQTYSEVGIEDVVTILQYITGGYGVDVLLPEYKLLLNLNGAQNEFDDFEDTLDVDFYKEDDLGNYVANEYSALKLPELYREGYKFLGWSYKIANGELISSSDMIEYITSQKQQIIYAQWELNQISLNSNGATNENVITELYYGENIPTQEFVKEYRVKFTSKNGENSEGILEYTLQGWKLDNEPDIIYENYSELLQILINEHIGHISVTAIWSDDLKIDFPKWEINGYKPVNWSVQSTIEEITNDNLKLILNDKNKYEDSKGDYYLVTANFVPIKFIVMLKYNGGESEIISRQEVSIEDPLYIPRLKVTRTGYKLSGWKDIDGNVLFSYSDTNDFVKIDYIDGVNDGDEFILDADWSAKNYSIKYYIDGVFYSTQTVTYDQDYVLTKEERTGYTHEEWCYNGVIFPNQQKWNIDSDIILTSSWINNQYEIKFNVKNKDDDNELLKKEISFDESPTTVFFDKSYEWGIPSAEYYEFKGWFTEEGVQLTDSKGKSLETWFVDGSLTVYGCWEKTYSGYKYLSTKEDFEKIRTELDGKFVLIENISLSGVSIIPEFNGELIGALRPDKSKWSLKDWSFTQDTSSYIGLFRVNNGIIENIKIENFIITNQNPNVTGSVYAGSLCGSNNKNAKLKNIEISGVHVNIDVGDIKNDSQSWVNVGGLCGYNSGTLENITVHGKSFIKGWVTTQYGLAHALVGGIVGHSNGGQLVGKLICNNNTIYAGSNAELGKNWIGVHKSHGISLSYVGCIAGQTNSTVYDSSNFEFNDNTVTADAQHNCSKHKGDYSSSRGGSNTAIGYAN